MRITLTSRLAFAAIFLVTCSSLVGYANQKGYIYTVKGRIVDESGHPVPNVTVALKSPQYGEGDLVYLDGSDEAGRFVIQKKSTRPIVDWKLYVSDTSLVPENTDELLDIGSAFCGEYYKALCGKKVRIPPNRVEDLGDQRLEVRHYPLLVRFFDRDGRPLISERKTFGPGFTPWWRVRDPLGDIIGEGGNAQVHYRFNQSAVMIALPAGKWTLDISDDDGSDYRGIFEIEVEPSKVIQEVELKLSKEPSHFVFEGQRRYPLSDRIEARREIRKRGFKFGRTTFENRVGLGNHKVVELFLRAGMDPNVLTKNRDFLMMALDRQAVLKLLLEAGADVNRKTEGGITPLLQAVGWSVIPTETIKMLLDAGADLNARDKDGRDAFSLLGDRPELLAFLKSYKPKLTK